MLAENVVKLNNSQIYDLIEFFLEKKLLRSGSEETKKAYESDIRDFFEFITNGEKEIQFLTVDDIQLENNDVVKYQIYLKKHKDLENKTINRKVTTARQLYGIFERNGLVNDITAFDEADRLREGKNYYGTLTVSEVFQMANMLLDPKRKRIRKRKTKHFLLLFAMDTCLRKSAILNLKWTDFIEHGNEVEVKAVDKGSKELNPRISKDFYNQLLQLKEESSTDRVFDISENAIQDMMNKFQKWMGFEKKRRITFHSLKKCGVTFQYNVTGGDIMQAKKAAGHANVNTTMIYIDDRDYGVLGAVSSAGKIDDKLYKKVTHGQLLKAIENLNKDQILLLNMELNKLIN